MEGQTGITLSYTHPAHGSCLIPEKDELGIFLEGDLAAMLVFATNRKNAMHHPDAGVLNKFLMQDSLVAGAGFEP
ncbi:hypothetical protein AD933_02350, partial [Acetobacter malorum]